MADSRETSTRCAILTSDAGNQSHGPWHGCSKGSSDRQDATAPVQIMLSAVDSAQLWPGRNT